MSDEIRRIGRHARRAAKFPHNAKCTRCPETDPIVLVEGSEPLLCYRCQALRDGKSGFEADHFAGAANSPITFELPANTHRRYSDSQQDWRDTLENRDGNPLLKISALVRGWLGYLQIILNALEHVPVALETLSDCLIDSLGARWWDKPQFLGLRACIENA